MDNSRRIGAGRTREQAPLDFPTDAWEIKDKDSTPQKLGLSAGWALSLDNDTWLGGDLIVSGDITSTGGDVSAKKSFRINNSGAYNIGYFWENNKHQINANDGGGNVNIRFGNDYQTGMTEDGYGTHIVFSQSAGNLDFKITTESQLTGETPVWATPLRINEDGIEADGVWEKLWSTPNGVRSIDIDSVSSYDSGQFLIVGYEAGYWISIPLFVVGKTERSIGTAWITSQYGAGYNYPTDNNEDFQMYDSSALMFEIWRIRGS